MAAESLAPSHWARTSCAGTGTDLKTAERLRSSKSSPRAISTRLLNTLLCVHIEPIDQVVYLGPYPVKLVGGLISRRASRLDAFSGYPFQT